MIDRFGDKNAPAGLKNSVHQLRAPPPLGLLQHCDFITAAIGRIAAHGILPQKFRRDNNVQMRPRRPSRQIRAIHRHKPVFLDRTRPIFHLSDRHLNDRRFVIVLVKMQVISRTCGRFFLIDLCCDHGLIGLNASFAVHRGRIWIRMGCQGRGIHCQSLVFVLQIQIFLQGSSIDRMGCGAISPRLGQFQIPPPFFDRVQLTMTGHIIHFCQNWRHLWHVHCRPAERRFGKQPLKVPRAGFHAASTHSAARGADTIAGTFLTVRFPNFIAVEHQFWPSRDCP